MTSIMISFISIIYGLSRFTLRNILGRDPKISENLFYAFIELSTTLTILHSPLVYVALAESVYNFLGNDYIVIIIGTFIVCIVLWIFPLLVSVCILSPRVGLQLCMIIDYRIYFSFVCQHRSSMADLVRARRDILIVTILNSLVTLATGVFILYLNIVDYGTILLFSIISLFLTILEIMCIICSKKSFLNCVFLSSLKERTSDPEDHVHSENVIELIDIPQSENKEVAEDETLPEGNMGNIYRWVY